MTAPAPSPVECQILHCKHLFKLKTRHDASTNIYQKPTNLIAVCTVHGLTFVGERNAFKVIASFKLYKDPQNFNGKILEKYDYRNIELPASPTHIDINAEEKLLAVAFIHDDVPILRIYMIDSFFDQNITHFPEIRLSSTGGTHITDLCWNPGFPNILACCISDGSLSTYTFNSPNNFEVKSLPKESSSVCVCWSPKGKQIVVGNYSGYLTQYLPELKAVKNVSPPTGLFPKACTLCSVKWISNFQFIGTYKTQDNSVTEDEEIKSCVVVINTPKNAPVQYVNYDDVCFSGGTDRPVQFYFNHIPSWNLIFVSSSNSLEVAVLSLSQDNQTWVLWNLEPEEMRITLPFLSSGEAFPVGVAIDYSVPLQVPMGDKYMLFPAISVMTCEGLLCTYLINYLNPSVPNVCTPSNGLASLEYFSSESVIDDDSSQKQSSEILPTQDSPNCQDFSGVAYHTDQSSSQIQETMSLTDATLRSAQEQLQIQSVNLMTKLSSAFDFESSLAKEMAPESTNTQIMQASSIMFNVETQNASAPSPSPKMSEQSNSSLSSNQIIGIIKKSEPPKPRVEAGKKLKKRASVFENDIQEIKYLVNNINVGSSEPRLQLSEKFAALESTSRKLKVANAELRNDLDHLRTSVIEVFAYVQDVKSKLFQFMNPGYQSLTGVQDIDPISANNLKTVQSSINYVRTQVEKANKQLEEVWFKFSQNSPAPTTKVPILENVYETMVKQQKILGYLKLQTEKLEKRFTAITHRLTRENRHTSSQSDPWSMDQLLNENMSLDELTKKALNLNSLPDDQLQPKQLALKYSREHAKRFHLSYVKQVKLQELHSTSGVTFIQSGRLQRLKKKSLIILSKNKCEPDTNVEQIAQKGSEQLRVAMISPVSSDDEKLPATNYVVSSTPVKNAGPPRFPMESTLPIEPSIIRPITSTAPPKLLPSILMTSSITVPSSSKPDEVTISESSEPIVQEPVAIATKSDPTPVEVVTTATAHIPAPVAEKTTSFFGNAMFAGKLPAAPPPMFSNTLQQGTVSAPMAPPPLITTNHVLFSGTGATASVNPSVAGTVSTQKPLLSNFNSGSFFSNLSNTVSTTASSSVGATGSSVTSSFTSTKPETSATVNSSPLAAVSMTSSIFSGKPLFDTTPTSQVKPSLPNFGSALNVVVSSSSGESLFKAIATSSNALPSFGNFAAAVTGSKPIAMPNESSVSATFTVQSSVSASIVTSSSSVFGNSSVFGKPAPTATGIISSLDFGAMLSGPTSCAENSPIIESSAATAATTVTAGQKNSAFSSFSFANKPPVLGSTVTITEVTNDEEKEPDKENIGVAPANTTTFSFANPPLSFSPVKILTPPSNTTISATSATVTPSFSPNVSTPANVANAPFSGSTALTPVASPPFTSASGTGAFDGAGSFFSSLKLGPATAAGSTNANPPVFGKAQPISSTPSLFSGSGGNIFSQTANTTTASTTTESKPLFGSGTAAPLFGSSTVATTENKNLFSGSSANGNFQSNTGSLFSGGGSMFGSTFGGASTTQASTFGSTSGGSIFGSNFGASSFQNTSGGFGSPPSFSNNLQQQQQQPQPTNASGFGSPASFSNAFSKPGSTFSAFGSAPTFGGSPSFGTSPTKVFGQSSVNMGTFSNTAAQQPTTFDTLANENTLTFGNLAQQQQPSTFGSPSSFGSTNTNNPTFGSGSNFGSSSFSSWR